MSDIALRSAPRPNRFDAFANWLRQMRSALSVPAPHARYLPDCYLRDIGLRRCEIARAVDEGSARIGLLDLGWQTPRRRDDI